MCVSECQCVSVCVSVWQCVAVCVSVWQCVAVCVSVWQCGCISACLSVREESKLLLSKGGASLTLLAGAVVSDVVSSTICINPKKEKKKMDTHTRVRARGDNR